MQTVAHEPHPRQEISRSQREIVRSPDLERRFFSGPNRRPIRSFCKPLDKGDREALVFGQMKLLLSRRERGLPMNATSLRGAAKLLDELAEVAA